jgi:hypothetical protein
MRTALLFVIVALFASGARAQLINGSFEDALGNPSDSGWVATCTTMPGPAAAGFGNWGILVPHSNAPGCGWSRLDQLVPAIADGETWTLSGWCCNFTWFWADPYIGFRFGIKHGDGSLSFNTAALMNFGTWDYLQVTNTFTLAVDDTVFVECDPGTVSGSGTNEVFANFDGVQLTSVPTGLPGTASAPQLIMRPNPVVDRFWVAAQGAVIEARAIGSDGSMEALPFRTSGSTAEIDASALSAGVHTLWARTASGIATARFVKY